MGDNKPQPTANNSQAGQHGAAPRTTKSGSKKARLACRPRPTAEAVLTNRSAAPGRASSAWHLWVHAGINSSISTSWTARWARHCSWKPYAFSISATGHAASATWWPALPTGSVLPVICARAGAMQGGGRRRVSTECCGKWKQCASSATSEPTLRVSHPQCKHPDRQSRLCQSDAA